MKDPDGFDSTAAMDINNCLEECVMDDMLITVFVHLIH